MDTNSIFSSTWNATPVSETDAANYSQLSALALVAFCFGLASYFIFFTIWFGFLGILGTILGVLAVTHIRRSEGLLTGLAMAYLAIVLSMASLVSVSVMWPYYHYVVRQESDRFFRIWFTALEENNIPLARGMSSVYWERPSTENHEKWWNDHYRLAHKDLHRYTENALIRTLLALGKSAKVTYYKTLEVSTDDAKDRVTAVYAVTYPGADEKPETFFVKIKGVRRFPSGDVKSAGWQLEAMPEVFMPPEFLAQVSLSSFPPIGEKREK